MRGLKYADSQCVALLGIGDTKGYVATAMKVHGDTIMNHQTFQ